jgi:hypothetical protein
MKLAGKWWQKWWVIALVVAAIVLPFKMISCAQEPTTAERVLFEYDSSVAVMQYRMRTGLDVREATSRLMEARYPQLREYYRQHPEERRRIVTGK